MLQLICIFQRKLRWKQRHHLVVLQVLPQTGNIMRSTARVLPHLPSPMRRRQYCTLLQSTTAPAQHVMLAPET
jgi:hypothetical protein